MILLLLTFPSASADTPTESVEVESSAYYGPSLPPTEPDEEPTSPVPLDPPLALGQAVPPAAPLPSTLVLSPDPTEWGRLIPHVRARGLRTALAFGLLGGLFIGWAAALRRLNRMLRPTGLLPTTVRTVEVLLRLMIVFVGLGAVGALVPASIAPALPIVVMAAAVALGWSARDVAQDLIAGLFIAVEGQLRAGFWISGERYSGSVEALGLRVTWLRDVHGRRIVVPNRVLLAQPLVTDDKPWPRIQFRVGLPLNAPTRDLRKALEEAILLSPWVAPEPEMEVHPDALDADIWHVAVRVLDSRYAHRFQGLLRERVEEILAPPH